MDYKKLMFAVRRASLRTGHHPSETTKLKTHTFPGDPRGAGAGHFLDTGYMANSADPLPDIDA